MKTSYVLNSLILYCAISTWLIGCADCQSGIEHLGLDELQKIDNKSGTFIEESLLILDFLVSQNQAVEIQAVSNLREKLVVSLKNGGEAPPPRMELIQQAIKNNPSSVNLSAKAIVEIELLRLRDEVEDRGGFQTLDEQIQIVKEELGSFDVIENGRQFFNLAIFLRRGGLAFCDNTGIGNLFDISEQRREQAISEIAMLRQKGTDELEKINVDVVKDYLDFLDKKQRGSLASRLGIEVGDLHLVYAKTTISGLLRIFTPNPRPFPIPIDQSEFRRLASALKHVLISDDEHLLDVELRRRLSEFKEYVVGFPPGTFSGPEFSELISLLNEASEVGPSVGVLKYHLETKEFWTWSGFQEFDIRYHVEEVSAGESERISEAMQNSFAKLISHNRSPTANYLRLGSLSSRLSQSEWPLTKEQKRLLSEFSNEWDSELKEARTFEEFVEINNRRLKGLDRVLLPQQSCKLFERMLAYNGLHLFLQRPDVIEDFRISEMQTKKLNEFAATVGSQMKNRESKVRKHLILTELEIVEALVGETCINLFGVSKGDISDVLEKQLTAHTAISRLAQEKGDVFSALKRDSGAAERTSFDLYRDRN